MVGLKNPGLKHSDNPKKKYLKSTLKQAVWFLKVFSVELFIVTIEQEGLHPLVEKFINIKHLKY